MISPTQFAKIAPYLHNYFVLIGFIVAAVTGILYWVLNGSDRAKLSNPQKLTLWLTIAKYAFWFGIVSMLSGLAYSAFHTQQNTNSGPAQSAPVKQQASDCSANVNGANNVTSVNCADKNGGNK
jgi:hypothetical protein